MPYSSSVFINCPFDREYRDLLEKLVFILEFYDFTVHLSTNTTATEDRLENIIALIRKSKYSFHDLSRHIARKKGEFARFNMPFELGIDFGCAKFGKGKRDKIIAILDSALHDYDEHTSDLSGRDILCHHNQGDTLFQLIPEWLSRSSDTMYDGPKNLKGYFVAWNTDYKSVLNSHGYDMKRINDLSIDTYIRFLRLWIPKWKAENNYRMPAERQ